VGADSLGRGIPVPPWGSESPTFGECGKGRADEKGRGFPAPLAIHQESGGYETVYVVVSHALGVRIAVPLTPPVYEYVIEPFLSSTQ
jgi:hypothetical protein